MTYPKTYVKLYQAKRPINFIPHLDTVQEIKAEQTPQGYVWTVNGNRHCFLREDEEGICYPVHDTDIEKQSIAGTSIVAVRNLYEKELESRKLMLRQMMDSVVNELDHVRYEEVNLVTIP